uniref:Alternative protein CUEDC1 n=1 Tax=Homo sapiens TaxID=9606 RepID=L0R845_HUMAN|nr:alternative protein CUEDC1 [Homo sapiens]
MAGGGTIARMASSAQPSWKTQFPSLSHAEVQRFIIVGPSVKPVPGCTGGVDDRPPSPSTARSRMPPPREDRSPRAAWGPAPVLS